VGGCGKTKSCLLVALLGSLQHHKKNKLCVSGQPKCLEAQISPCFLQVRECPCDTNVNVPVIWTSLDSTSVPHSDWKNSVPYFSDFYFHDALYVRMYSHSPVEPVGYVGFFDQ